MLFTAGDIADHLGGKVQGDRTMPLTGFQAADRAKSGDLTFAENRTFFERAEQSAASAIIVDKSFTSERKVLILVPSARLAFAKVVPLFYPEPGPPTGIHSSAIISDKAHVHPEACIGAHVIICDNVRIGARSVLHGNNYIDEDCIIGEDSAIFHNVTLYPRTEIGNRVRIHAGTIIGSDGFGYVQEGGKHLKVPQIGNVEIDDDVEIGANVTIDRGALGPTHIGSGTKIDNLVQVAHNVSTGENCLVVAQAGVAGSTKLGNSVILAGQVGLAGHLRIGDNVTIAAQSGVMRDIRKGEKWFGTPAQPDKKMKRQLLALHKLPELLRRYNRFEKFAKSRLLTSEEIAEAKAKVEAARAAKEEAKRAPSTSEENTPAPQ
ncbi:MAG: UDP-3-O-(3-hydroxymyristoyl)glucosamine N-acyltransferase [Verrucomicrobiota bacterium]|jgi:UDP-3-O-[3-hydroxymyristoyl] glucosamine N-acyltransferase|nr:UDP-3-O-(3-hydroxymyristoyl)glucosamine N-acyltransferase [Verrucomicrobiota bacterium]